MTTRRTFFTTAGLATGAAFADPADVTRKTSRTPTIEIGILNYRSTFMPVLVMMVTVIMHLLFVWRITMRKIKWIVLIHCFFIVSGGAISFSANTELITLSPLGLPEGEYGPIGFEIQTPWMDGSIEMRFPETLESEEGMYFIDHDRPDMPPLTKMTDYPKWHRDVNTGELSYSYTTPDGIEFGGIVDAASDEVHMDFYVRNHTGKRIQDMNPQLCLTLANSNDFNRKRDGSDVFIWSDGHFISLAKTTPTASEKGRDPLLVIARRGFKNLKGPGKIPFNGPGKDIFQWWMIHQESDEDIIFRESSDKKHLVAVSWPGVASFLIFNSQNPCIHAGPSIGFTVMPYRERHWYGTIYLLPNDPAELMKRYRSCVRNN